MLLCIRVVKKVILFSVTHFLTSLLSFTFPIIHWDIQARTVAAPSSLRCACWEGSCQTSTPVASALFIPLFSTAEPVTTLTSPHPQKGPDTASNFHVDANIFMMYAHNSKRTHTLIHKPHQTHLFRCSGVLEGTDPQLVSTSRGADLMLPFPSQPPQTSLPLYRLERPGHAHMNSHSHDCPRKTANKQKQPNKTLSELSSLRTALFFFNKGESFPGACKCTFVRIGVKSWSQTTWISSYKRLKVNSWHRQVLKYCK